MTSVKVIDAPCGSGKTTWAISEINSRPEDSFIFCTPLLTEIDRIRHDPDDPEAPGCGTRMRQPLNFDSSKLEDFEKLLGRGDCIAVTHSTFLNSTDHTGDLIEEGEYILILDEVAEVITEFNKLPGVKNAPEQRVTMDDFHVMQDDDQVTVDIDGRIHWVGSPRTEGTKHSVFANLCNLGRLRLARDKMIICLFPPEVFSKFKEVYLLTYLFEGSILKYYLDLFEIPYEKVSIDRSGEHPELVAYSDADDFAFREMCRQKVKICDDWRLNDGYTKGAFSKNWYSENIRKTKKSKKKSPKLKDDSKKVSTSKTERIRTDLNYFFYRYAGALASENEVMWSCPRDYYDSLKGKGYTLVKRLTKEEKAQPVSEREVLEKKYSCFVPLNSRGTNIYIDRWALAYVFNMRMNPMLKGFFLDVADIEINEDLFAIGCLIQWMCRSRIRRGEDIVIYLPSPRMCSLLERWIDGDTFVGEQ